jgi:hypothetical protein
LDTPKLFRNTRLVPTTRGLILQPSLSTNEQVSRPETEEGFELESGNEKWFSFAD